MEITNLKEQFGEYLYSRLPKVYRDYDVEVKRSVVIDGETVYVTYKTLEEYLKALALGGFEPIQEDIEAMISLVDPQNCPKEYLPLLLQHFGLDYIDDIDEKYQRRLLQNALILYRKKGTLPAVVFLARELSGFKVTVEETEEGGVSFALVKMSAYSEEEAQQLNNAQVVIERYIHLFLPATVQPKVSTEYGYSEFIGFNGEPDTNLDKVRYDYHEECEDFGYKYFYVEYETPVMEEGSEDFSIQDFGFIENAFSEILDTDSFTNDYVGREMVQINGVKFNVTNGYSTLDKITLI